MSSPSPPNLVAYGLSPLPDLTSPSSAPFQSPSPPESTPLFGPGPASFRGTCADQVIGEDRVQEAGARGADLRSDRYLRSSSSNKSAPAAKQASNVRSTEDAKEVGSGNGVGGSDVVRTSVLILGAGLAGITAARTLQQAGMDDFLVLEATDRVGGRMCEASFCGLTVEAGANWIHGVEKHKNPLWQLAQQVNLKMYMSELEDITARDSNGRDITEEVEQAWDVMAHAEEEAIARGKEEFIVEPETRTSKSKWSEGRSTRGDRVLERDSNGQTGGELRHRLANEVDDEAHESRRSRRRRRARSSGTVLMDASLRDAMQLATGWTARTPAQILAEYYQTDFEYAMVPNAVSWIGSSTLRQKNLFGDQDALVMDQRGFSTVVRHMAAQVFAAGDRRLVLGEEVCELHYDLCPYEPEHRNRPRAPDASLQGVLVLTSSGRKYFARYCLITFANNVLTSGHVRFVPPLPAWKKRALACSPTLAFNKIFVKFAADQEPFWDPTEWVLFADSVPVACARAPAPPAAARSPPRSPARGSPHVQPKSAQEQLHELASAASKALDAAAPNHSNGTLAPAAAAEEAPLQELVRIRKKSAALSSAQTRGDKFTRGFYSVWLNLNKEGLFPGSNALLGFVVDEMARQVESKSEQELKHEIGTVFRTLYGEHVPEPEAVMCTRWCSNRYTCGAYSSLARGCSPAVAHDLSRCIGNVHFAGEGTDAEFTGYLNGAYRTGIVQARALLEKLGWARRTRADSLRSTASNLNLR